MKTNVGYNVNFKPEAECSDSKCPHHGEISVRGTLFEGTVISDSMDKTVKVEWETLEKDTKYSRYFKTKSKVSAHNPACVNAKVGDRVLIGETRPMSKTKHFAVLKVTEE
ncbi:MAG: 30S ribosomal protein S17 [Candidatus Woesearchaeota archaeon]|jgi:small subunit ribosomal protein S17|nr:30S ribosomal protein S17 [Candidatus Woesearchaeota archaeon]